jgi:hypothetical protein
MTPPSPHPDTLAQWLLAHEAGDDHTPEAWVTAAAQVHARLRAGLMVFLGQAGFDSLWARALHLAQPPVPARVGPTAGSLPPLLPDAQAAWQDHDAAAARTALGAPVARFIALLFTFVGADLGVRLLHTIWPALPLGTSAPHTSEALP